MSSMRNATQRRNHRERAQLLEREAKLGILEKHKDYSLRSKNHNENKKRLKILRQKAAERNPDEFSYGMLSSQSKKGLKLAGRQNPVLDQDAVRLLKTQDAGYVTTMLQKTQRSQVKLEQEFVLKEGKGVELLGAFSSQKKGSHKIFVDSRKEQMHYEREGKVALRSGSGYPFSSNEEDDSDRVACIDFSPKPSIARYAAENKDLASKQDKIRRTHCRQEQDARRLKLAALNARELGLIEAKNELDLQRAKMSNNVGGINKVGIKWKVRERKK